MDWKVEQGKDHVLDCLAVGKPQVQSQLEPSFKRWILWSVYLEFLTGMEGTLGCELQ